MATIIDKNFMLNNVTRTDVVWYNPKNKPFSIHGVYFEEKTDRYVRMPSDVAKTVGDFVLYLSAFTAGGRIRFKTNSPFIALKVTEIKCFDIMTHMPISGEYGFSVYVDGKYLKFIAPEQKDIVGKTDFISFDGLLPLDGSTHDIEIYFPLYFCVKEVFVGLQENATVEEHPQYAHPTPVLFYGSSITQGGCASHAGNDYVNLLSRLLNVDVINLGFSGNAKGEPEMANYIAGINASVFVLDYDHNSPKVEHLEKTHYSLYETIRKAHPTTPIILISRPDFEREEINKKRRDVIIKTYKTAIENGDKYIDFIDGETLFGTEDRDCCTVDGCHPNDLGFYRMAKTIEPTLKKWLNK